jgi:type II secretory pathway pseudopilin PulG
MARIKIKSSTLIETMVAMVILCLVMGTAMVVFIQATSSSISYNKVKAGFLIRNVMADTQKNQLFVDEELERDNIKILKTISSYGSTGTLVKVEIVAFNSEEKILATSYAILKQHE